jgi:hypothetical protein
MSSCICLRLTHEFPDLRGVIAYLRGFVGAYRRSLDRESYHREALAKLMPI